MKHERETLEAVINARNQAQSAAKTAAADPSDASAIQGLAGAEGALTGAMGRMFALMESYPDLKANQNVLQLQEELTSTEKATNYPAEQDIRIAVVNRKTCGGGNRTAKVATLNNRCLFTPSL